MKPCPVVHFEIPARDMKRVSKFYAEAFGWKNQEMGEEMGHYIVTSTGKVGAHGRPAEPGFINGGLYPDPEKKYVPSIVIAVEDINKHVEIVKKAGGKVNDKPIMIPHIGWFVSFIDTEGNRVTMLQPEM